MTVRVLLADDEHLIRGALAALLSLEDDLVIVKQVAELIGTLIESPVRGTDSTAEQRRAIRRVVKDDDFPRRVRGGEPHL